MWSGHDCQIVSYGKLQKLSAVAPHFQRQKGLRGEDVSVAVWWSVEYLFWGILSPSRQWYIWKELGLNTSDDKSNNSCIETAALEGGVKSRGIPRGERREHLNNHAWSWRNLWFSKFTEIVGAFKAFLQRLLIKNSFLFHKSFAHLQTGAAWYHGIHKPRLC